MGHCHCTCHFVDAPKPPPPSPPGVQLLDLRAATTYQDSSLFDKQAPVSDLSYADSTTGRPWAECGQYTSQWWGVDLGSEVYVRYVRLQNRNDCCAERLTDVDIYLGSTAETYTGNALVKSDVSVLSNVMLEVEINALGRYIYLNRPSAAGLTVCKFYVFAGNRNGPPPSASPSPPPPSTPGASCKAGLCTGDIFETCFYDPGCAAGGLGCNAGGKTLCRFCEFGPYKAIECAP